MMRSRPSALALRSWSLSLCLAAALGTACSSSDDSADSGATAAGGSGQAGTGSGDGGSTTTGGAAGKATGGSAGASGSGTAGGGAAGAGTGGTGTGGTGTGGTGTGGTGTGGTGTGGSGTAGTGTAGSGGSGTAGSGTAGSGTGGTGTAGSGTGGTTSTGAPTAAELLTLVANCNKVGGQYATDDGEKETISICGLKGAVFWQADMDVDCDGKMTTQCNASTDGAYQNQTSFQDSKGDWLDAATLPYVVVPLPSNRWDYMKAGVKPGAVVAVLYKGQIVYGVFGDEGPDNIIGESSYAMAKALGIDPDPSTGGTDSGVTYIVFLGDTAVQDPIEDHAGATTLGEKLATQLLKDN